MSDGRPEYCANIYKHGRLKTRKEMDEDGTLDRLALHRMPKQVRCKSFDELKSEIKPVSKDLVDEIKELTDCVEVDFEAPLNPDDD